MKARLIKETRDLLPAFASMLTLIVALCFIWPTPEVCLIVLAVACVVMAGSSFGNELQHRTLSLLLSQPVARSVLWHEKMLVLGAAILASLVALYICLVGGLPLGPDFEMLALLLIPLCAFCGGPYWTLLLRHEIGGMVFAAAAPITLLTVSMFVIEQLPHDGVPPYRSTNIVPLLLYCALVYWRGYARFKRLQVVDGPARDVSLPEGLEARLTRPLTMLSSRFRGPFASLLKKEFRLQQISFLLAGVFFLIAVAGSCLLQYHQDPGSLIVGLDFVIYVLVLPLVAGAVSVAEEKGWDMAEWHLTLPPSALQQWSAKMLAALSTSLVLGLVLPAILLIVGDALFAKGDALNSLPPASQILCWVLGQLLLTSVAVYAASFCNSTIRAILAACAIIALGGVTGAIVAEYGDYVLRSDPMQFRPASVRPQHLEYMVKTLIPLLIATSLLGLLGLVHRFAWSNFQRVRPSAVRVGVQLLVALCTCGLLAFALPCLNTDQGYALCCILYGLVGGLWLTSIIAAIIAIRWSFLDVRGRFVPAIILSLLALAIAYLGIVPFRAYSTMMVSGQVTQRFDSRWLFIPSLILGGFALLYAIWKKARSRHEA